LAGAATQTFALGGKHPRAATTGTCDFLDLLVHDLGAGTGYANGRTDWRTDWVQCVMRPVGGTAAW